MPSAAIRPGQGNLRASQVAAAAAARRRQRCAAEPLDGCGHGPQPERTWLERGRRRGVVLVALQEPAVTAGRLSVAEGARTVLIILGGRCC